VGANRQNLNEDIQANEKTAFATKISQAVKKEKLNEETRLEAKQERQKKVVKDRNDKNERRQGVQGGFGHGPRNEPALFQYREIEIWMKQNPDVQMA
jgi:predicted ATPase